MTAIRGGMLTFEALRRELGVGTGNCKAKRCRPKIEERIKDRKATGPRPVEVEQEPVKPS